MKDIPNFYIPEVMWNLTTKRVLTTEWINGIKLTNVQELQKQNISTEKVMTTFIEALSHQIFISGFVHSGIHKFKNLFLNFFFFKIHILEMF